MLFSIRIFVKFYGLRVFFGVLWLDICVDNVFSGQNLKKHRGKVLLWPFYGGLRKTICKMAALFLQFRIQFILQKARVTREWDKFFYFYAFFPLD